MRLGIICLYTEGGQHLCDCMRKNLLTKGCQMLTSEPQKKRILLKHPDYEGCIETRGARRVVGGFAGIEFLATLDHQSGTTVKVTYLIPDIHIPTPEQISGVVWSD